MSDSGKSKHVLIIDRQPSWRDRAAAALSDKGYMVQVLDSYDYQSDVVNFSAGSLDLVILGCSRIKHEERELINKVLADHRHLVVLCSSLPWGDMRSLFLAGADDVVDDKPYDATRLVSIVEGAFASLTEK